MANCGNTNTWGNFIEDKRVSEHHCHDNIIPIITIIIITIILIIPTIIPIIPIIPTIITAIRVAFDDELSGCVGQLPPHSCPRGVTLTGPVL